MSEMVTIKTYGTRMEAEFAQSRLAEAGIESMVSGDDLGGLIPSMDISVQLVVMQEVVKQAMEVLAKDKA